MLTAISWCRKRWHGLIIGGLALVFALTAAALCTIRGEKTTANVNPVPLNSSNLFNVIYTGIDYTLNKSTGVISTNDFSIGVNVVRLTSGNLINNNLQNSIFMNINSKRNTSDFLKTRMI